MYFDAWMTITVQLFSCENILSSEIFPKYLTEAEHAKHCQKNVQHNHISNQYHKFGYFVLEKFEAELPASATRVAMDLDMQMKHVELFESGMYLKASSHVSQNITVEFKMNLFFWQKFQRPNFNNRDSKIWYVSYTSTSDSVSNLQGKI